jgi:hypothetical protein
MKEITLTQGSLKYRIGKSLSMWAISTEERNLEIGHTRVIGKVLMYVCMKDPGILKSTYYWCPVDDKFNTFKNLEKWLSDV